jgi:hypothetical protein
MENKTAVEWLHKEIIKKSINDPEHNVLGIYEQAKRLFQEQIEKAFDESRKTHPMIGFKWQSFDEYYKETFKSE